MKTNRRSVFKKLTLALGGVLGLGAAKAASPASASEKKVSGVVLDQGAPLFSSAVVHNGLVYVAGKGAHFEGDITAHTDHVLNELKTELEKNGSSMEHVLKVNVYLADLNDYKKMNEVYKGRFGSKPPVRTTIAAYGGVPGDSLVEIDCIAMVKS
ncbi:MAG TPA: RidA family protein [Chryseosolibacter sp.]|jgi:enamine deaminase RidA (YjgF/YER057c/UK114 family)|nr:RidA family protein [Chryseosolibacter sp.]